MASAANNMPILHDGACIKLGARGTDGGVPTLDHKATNAESLSLDHLRAFIAVVETGSQVRAAKRRRVAQTTICRHIERVQEHFGGALFEAGASGPLSTRGLLVEQSVRAAMAELSRTRDRLLVDGPVFRIGFIRAMRPLVETALRNQVAGQQARAFDVRLLELSADKQALALDRGELDIAISYAIPELSTRDGIEESLVSEEPFALVIPERAWVRGKPSLSILASLLYAYSPRRLLSPLEQAETRWLRLHRLEPTRTIECERGSEILAYAGAGCGYGFLPALWSMANHDGIVFAPIEFGATAKIAAYSLRHVTPKVTRLRESLSNAARTALREFRVK